MSPIWLLPTSLLTLSLGMQLNAKDPQTFVCPEIDDGRLVVIHQRDSGISCVYDRGKGRIAIVEGHTVPLKKRGKS